MTFNGDSDVIQLCLLTPQIPICFTSNSFTLSDICVQKEEHLFATKLILCHNQELENIDYGGNYVMTVQTHRHTKTRTMQI